MKKTPLQFLYSLPKLLIISASFMVLTISTTQASEISVENVVALVNSDRASNGISELRLDPLLTLAAEAKLNDMVQQGYFAHTSPQGNTPWIWIQKFQYDYVVAGENLAIRFNTAEEQEAAWMESTKHREDILNPRYKDIGVAIGNIQRNNTDEVVVVQMFGLRVGDSTSSIQTDGIDTRISGTSTIESISSIASVAQMPQGRRVESSVPEDTSIKEEGFWTYAHITIVLVLVFSGLGIGFFLAVIHFKTINVILGAEKDKSIVIEVQEHKNAYVK